MRRFDIREYMHTNFLDDSKEDGFRDILFSIDFYKGVEDDLEMTKEELEDIAYYLVLSIDEFGNKGVFFHSDLDDIFIKYSDTISEEEKKYVLDYFENYIEGNEIG